MNGNTSPEAPVDRAVLEAYRQWLHLEGRLCGMELYPEMGVDAAARIIPETFAADFHFPLHSGWRHVPKPSTRAELVLRTVGVLPEPDIATDAEVAALEFEPWEHKPGEWVPPSDAEWSGMANPHLIILRTAWVTLFKTKAELIESVDGAGLDMTADLIEAIQASADFFTKFTAVLDCASARLHCAASTVIERDHVESEPTADA